MRELLTLKLHQNSWPKTEQASRYKLFSEVVLELVLHTSWDSYRSHALSTPIKAAELLKSLQKVSRKEVSKPSLEPQLLELRHSIEHDRIFKKIIKDKSIPESLFSFASNDSIEKLQTTSELFLELIYERYKSYCELELIRLCSKDNSKIDIILTTKLYISHIINLGYSQEYIHKRTKEYFYQDDISRCTKGLLKRFFNFFPDTSSKFTVYFGCGLQYSKFMDRQFKIRCHDSVESLSPELQRRIPNTFGQGDKKRIVPVRNVSAMDAYSAAKVAERLFSLSRSFLYLHPENVNVIIDRTAFAVNQKTNEVTSVRLDRTFSPRRAARSKGENASSISSLTDYVFSKASSNRRNKDGDQRILSSINSASLAAKTNDPESQLLSIWSAFEALLPDPLKDGEGIVRIVHFASLISPCAVFDYLPNTFSECFRNCSAEFGEQFLDVVLEEGVGESEIEKFTSIFIADQGAKSALCKAVLSSPLMLMRFHRLEKLVSNPNNALNYLDIHERRVGWQINRIYRERNSIVHKAETSPFLNGLIENAYSYYRSVILSLEKVYLNYHISHPDQGLEMVRVQYSEYKDHLRGISENSMLSTADRNGQFVKKMFSDCILASTQVQKDDTKQE